MLGKHVEQIKADSGDGTPDIAGAVRSTSCSTPSADVIVGAASSSVSLSASSTRSPVRASCSSRRPTPRPRFDTYDDKGLYFRTAPSDVLQGEVLANLVVEDGFKNVAILARQDSYGEGLAEQVEKTLEEKGADGRGHVALRRRRARTSPPRSTRSRRPSPTPIVLIAFDETTKIIPQLIAKGIGPQDIQIYFVDGNTGRLLRREASTSTGVKGTAPGAGRRRTRTSTRSSTRVDPKLKDFTYGAAVLRRRRS